MSRTMTHIAAVVGALAPAQQDLASILSELRALRDAFEEERAARVAAEDARVQLQAALEASEEALLVAGETILMLEERLASERAEAAREQHASALMLRAQRESMELELAVLSEELRAVRNEG